MKLIDMHCDTIGKILDLDHWGSLRENNCAVTISKLREADSLAQFFACFTKASEYVNGYEGCYEHLLEMIAFAKEQIHENGEEIDIACSWDDVRRCEEQKKLAAVLTVEEGGVLNNIIERLDVLYENNIRLMTLLWNYENCIGYPNSQETKIMERGLKPFGIETVERMGELGMIVDVSHASDGTFWDVLKYASSPVVASHSNCRSICNHPRNLSDEMIRALAEKGGVSGLNLYGIFLNGKKESTLDAMSAHVLHMLNKGGSDFAAIGTDFDGFGGMEREDIPDIAQMEKLWHILKGKGISEDQLEKIWHGNVMRIMKEI